MQHGKTLLAAGLLFSLTTLNAEASLTSYTANGVDFVRMQGGGYDVSWTKNGNLFQTMASTNANLISQIAAVTPTYNDRAYGLQIIDDGDFNTTGRMSWWGAKAWVNYLNNISYGGSNQWSLPGVTDIGAPGAQECTYSGTDCGYNVNPSTDPLAQLYYAELGKTAAYNTSGQYQYQNGFGIFGNNGAQVAGGAVGPFANVQSYAYWSGTESAPSPLMAWYFGTNSGEQDATNKGHQLYAWAVSPGQVAAVPVPAAVWLFGSGLIGLLGLKRRKRAG